MTCCLLQVCDLQAILRDTNHNGFPVVRDSSVGQICLGLISRAHLLALLQRLIDSYQTGSGRTASPGTSIPMAASVTMRQQLQQPLMAREVSNRRLLGREGSNHCVSASTQQLHRHVMTLCRFCPRSSWCVPAVLV